MIYICEDCKKLKLEQLGVKMFISIGYVTIGLCGECGKASQLYTYNEKKPKTIKNEQ